MTNTLLTAPQARNVMFAAQKFVPHHAQCIAIYINPKEPIAHDRLLNDLFPTLTKFDWDWSTSEGEAEIAESINSYLDVLCDVFSENRCDSAVRP